MDAPSCRPTVSKRPDYLHSFVTRHLLHISSSSAKIQSWQACVQFTDCPQDRLFDYMSDKTRTTISQCEGQILGLGINTIEEMVSEDTNGSPYGRQDILFRTRPDDIAAFELHNYCASLSPLKWQVRHPVDTRSKQLPELSEKKRLLAVKNCLKRTHKPRSNQRGNGVLNQVAMTNYFLLR